MGACSSRLSFECAGPITRAVMQAIEYTNAVEEGVNYYVSQHSCEARMLEMERRHREELNAANTQKLKELEAMRKTYEEAADANRMEVLEKNKTIMELQSTIEALCQPRARVLKQDGSTPEKASASSPETSPESLVYTKEPAAPPESSPESLVNESRTARSPSTSPSPPPSTSPSPPKNQRKRIEGVTRRFKLPAKRVSTSPKRKEAQGWESTPENEF